ncbi:MAG TPA: ATP-dependent helicase, partial [Bacteroidales bacterium]|nr:ATP-dependent helicase [Bacteroidales bacterium]
MTLGFRSTAGPFRSFGHIAVDPRPYQFVPLILAMRLDPVRLLIADDVGIGKTVEALLIARELIDRGEADGITVLCPPHLAEQWKTEMDLKFQIESELVLGSTASRLERDIGYDHSLFDIYPNTVVSLDYIKNQRRRDEFKRSCRNLVIVDEAHTCTEDFSSRVSSRQLRYDLLRDLAQAPDRHIILLTATPHSGKEGNFKS